MNYQAIEYYLRYAAEKERDELLSIITDPTSSYQMRREVLQGMETFAIFLSGFFYCVGISDSPEKAMYYQEYFDQARSEKGLDR